MWEALTQYDEARALAEARQEGFVEGFVRGFIEGFVSALLEKYPQATEEEQTRFYLLAYAELLDQERISNESHGFILEIYLRYFADKAGLKVPANL